MERAYSAFALFINLSLTYLLALTHWLTALGPTWSVSRTTETSTFVLGRCQSSPRRCYLDSLRTVTSLITNQPQKFRGPLLASPEMRSWKNHGMIRWGLMTPMKTDRRNPDYDAEIRTRTAIHWKHTRATRSHDPADDHPAGMLGWHRVSKDIGTSQWDAAKVDTETKHCSCNCLANTADQRPAACYPPDTSQCESPILQTSRSYVTRHITVTGQYAT